MCEDKTLGEGSRVKTRHWEREVMCEDKTIGERSHV